MKPVIRRAWIVALAMLCTPYSAVAETNISPSLEWTCCAAEVIAIGKISKIVTPRGPGSVEYEDYTIDVTELLKGKMAGKQIEFTLRRFTPTMQPIFGPRATILVFLIKSKNHGPEKHLDDKWVPVHLHPRPSVIDLVKPAEDVYSREMKIITDQKELLRIVREWAKSPIKHSLTEDVPQGPLFDKMYGGSACLLIVPAEEKYRPVYLKLARSTNANERARAASELWKFPGKDTEAALRELLKDDFQLPAYFARDMIETVSYHVRGAAYHSLERLGQQLPSMQLVRAPTPAEQRKAREQSWGEAFTTALKDGWKVSIADGPARIIDTREHVIVHVTCRRDKETVKLTLVPRDFPASELPKLDLIGINGRSSQGSRRFYADGAISDELRKTITSYFGLEK